MQIQLRTRLLLSSSITMLVIAGFLSFFVIQHRLADTDLLRLNQMKLATDRATELRLYAQYNLNDIAAYTLGHLEHRQEFDNDAQTFAALLEAFAQDIRTGLLDNDVNEQVQVIKQRQESYSGAAQTLFAAVDQNRMTPSAANQQAENESWEKADQLGEQVDLAAHALAQQIQAHLDELQAEVEGRNHGVLELGLALGILLGLLILFLQITTIRSITLPLRSFLTIVGRFAQGEYSLRVLLKQRDEIGALATGFNGMAQIVQERMTAEQEARRQTERLFEAEATSRQQLEHAVADYLTFVEQVAEGRLELEMHQAYDGALGKLGDGLQRMVHKLARAQEAAQQMQDDEVRNRQRLEQAVNDYLTFVQQVARGDLKQPLIVNYDGALGKLGAGLNQMAQNLHEITTQVKRASSNIAVAAREILTATNQQAASASEQAAMLAQMATTIEEVKTIARQTAQQARQGVSASQAMLDAAKQGTDVVEQTIDGMSHIHARVETIAQTILALSEQTQSISAIIMTVNELADQSNLLALNAAIEAARAGEQGKSFAVVAQHVRDLAERSKAATGQVRGILGEIKETATAAVLVTEEGTKGVERGTELVGQAGTIIHHIAHEVDDGAQTNRHIAAGAQQQTAGIEQIDNAMHAMQQATNQTVSSTQQAERAAQELHTLAQVLENAVVTYQL